MPSLPALVALDLADPPEAWRGLGFRVAQGGVELAGVRLRLGRPGRGITGWTLHGIPPLGEIDGLPTMSSPQAPVVPAVPEHPNGALALDHVVASTPDFDRTAAALQDAGLSLRRIRDAGGFRQGFRRLGPAVFELVEATGLPAGTARFWGLTVTVADLDALALELGDRLGEPRAAVQPGRRIATLRSAAGLSQPTAFMSPPPAP